MCDCAKQMNEALKEHNAALDIPMMTTRRNGDLERTGPKVVVATRKLSKSRKSLPMLFASYCPFCGEEYAA